MTIFEKMDISPVFYMVVQMIEEVDGVEEVNILSNMMYRLEPTEECPAGKLVVDILINNTKVILGYSEAEDMAMTSHGKFMVQELVNEVLK